MILMLKNATRQIWKKSKELIKNPPESCVLIFYLSNLDFNVKRPGKWGSFITAVNKTGITVNFKRKTNSELEKLLCSAAQKEVVP